MFGLRIEAQGADGARAGVRAVSDELRGAEAAATRARGALASAGASGSAAGEQAARGLDKARLAADGAGESINHLIQIAMGFIAVHKLEELADGYIETSNRIRAVSTDQANLNGLMDATFRVAQDARASWEDVATTYQRLGTVTKGLGLSQKDVIDLTEEMAMAAKVGGATNREAGASMAELTHAFATGALQGREFRVLMRDTPALMKELQLASGKTGGEFAEMGKKGQISATMIVDWFGKAAPSIREKFGNTIPTIAEGFTQIENAARKFFGEAAVGSGLMAELSKAMRFIADNFADFAKVAIAAGEAVIALYAIEKLIALFGALAAGAKALALSINSGPLAALNALVTGLLVGVLLLRQFGDQLETGKAVMTGTGAVVITVADNLNALWGQLKQLGSEIMTFLGEAWRALTGAMEDGISTKGIGDSLSGALRLVSGFVGGVREMFHLMATDSDKTWALMAYGLVEAMTRALNALMAIVGGAFGKLRHMAFEFLDKDSRDDEMKRATAIAKSQQAEDEASGRNARVRARVAADLGPGADPAAVESEYRARLRRDFDASRSEALNRFGRNADGSSQTETRTTIGHIDNPLEGTGVAATAHSAIADLGKAANKSMEEFDAAARSIAAQRAMDAAENKGTVGTSRATPDKAAENEKEAKAREHLLNQWRAMVAASNPVAAAEEHVRKAHEIGVKALAAGITSLEEYNHVMDETARKQADALHPFDAWVRKQGEASDALRANSDEQERAAKLVEFTEHMREKQAGGASKAEIAIAAGQIAKSQEHAKVMAEEQAMYKEFVGPQTAYSLRLKAAGDLLEKGTITSEQYAIATEHARAALLAAEPGARSFGARVEDAYLKMKEAARAAGIAEETRQHIVDQVRAAELAAGPEGRSLAGGMEGNWLKLKTDAESYGRVLSDQVFANLDKVNEALVNAANGGEVAWGKMADAMIQDLERVIIKQLEVMAITALLNGLAPGSGTVATSSGVSGGIADAFNSAAGTGSASSSLSMASSMPAPAVAAASRTAPAGFAPAPAAPTEIHIHNHQDGSSQGAYLTSRAGQRTINNVLRRTGAGMRQ